MTAEALHKLVSGEHPSTSWVGIALTASSLIGMLFLGVAKRRLVNQFGSMATRGEGTQNLLCAYFAGAVLIGPLGNTLFGLWWLEPVAALVMRESQSRKGSRAGVARACAAC